jgi:glycosyltransferase involved in cell wall biosynthesis
VTVEFHSPLPPARTGVADYSAALLAGFERYGEVWTRPRGSRRCDVSLYHLGNNSLHARIYRQALERPGVVVLHDAVLHHLFLGLLEQHTYVEEFVYNYGAWNRDLAGDLWQHRAGSASDRRYFQFPMLKRIAERSLAVIVHNPAAARAVKAHAPPQTAVVEIPHLFSQPDLPPEAAIMRYREWLGFDAGTFLLGVFGYLRESKRLATILDAFAALRRERPESALLIAGEFVSPDLERALKPLLAQPAIAYRPRLSEREFWLAAGAVDACINLRYPSAGETSAIAIRLMGIGKPVLLTDSEECARFPEDGCLRVASGLEERDSLWTHLVLLTSIPGVGPAIGHRGAGHIRAHHRLEQVARQYWDTLCAYRG